MVRGHQRDGLASEQPLAAADAAVEQHLREAEIVRRRRDAAAAARLPLRHLAGRVEDDQRFAGQRILRQRAGIAFARLVGQLETGVGHAERLPQALRQEVAEALAGHRLDDETEDVGRDAVFPRRAGLEQQRRLAEQRQEVVLAVRGAGAVHGIGAVGGAGAAVLVAETGGMPQQILHGHLALGRHRFEHVARDRLGDLHVGELGQELRYGIAEQQAPFLGEHHDADRHHRLGHRRDREHRIRPHRRAGGLVAEAIALEHRDFAMPRDADHRAGDHAGRDLAVDGLANATEPARIETEFGGGRPLQDCAGSRGGRHGFISPLRAHRRQHAGGALHPAPEALSNVSLLHDCLQRQSMHSGAIITAAHSPLRSIDSVMS